MITQEQQNNILVGDYKSWPSYDLQAMNVVANGKQTKFQAIFYKGNLVSVLTKAYHVLPNEDVLKVADEAAYKVGASPYFPKQSPWFSWFGDKSVKENNRISNVDGTRVAAFYMFDEQVDVTGKGDIVQKGFSVSTSIDGSSGVRVSPLDVRKVCNNIMMHLFVEKSLQAGAFEVVSINSEITKKALANLVEAQMDTTSMNKRHVKSLTPDLVAKGIDSIKEKSDKVMARYKEMVELKLTVYQAQQIVRKLPKVITNKLGYIQIGKDDKIIVDDKTTQWKAFNDITEILTHGDLTYRSTLEHYRNVDSILVRA